MSFFRDAMRLFRGRARKDRHEGVAEPVAGPVPEQAATAEARPPAARRQVKREARPDPSKPGWGQTVG